MTKPAGPAITSPTFRAIRHVLELRAILWAKRRRRHGDLPTRSPQVARLGEVPPSASRYPAARRLAPVNPPFADQL
jgi:hypothetical protein